MTLFVYGRLMSPAELNRVLGRAYTGGYRPHTLTGYRRTWTALDGEIAYLDLKTRAGSSVKGFLVDLTEEDFNRLDDWELGYQRVSLGGMHFFMSAPDRRQSGSFVLRSYLRLVQSVTPEPLPDIPKNLTTVDDE